MSLPLPTWTVVVLTVATLLVGSALLYALAARLGYAVLGAVVAASRRVAGRLPPDWRQSGLDALRRLEGVESRGSSFPALARLFVGIGRRLPGGRRTDTAAVILPLLVVGVPLFALFVLAVWVAPIYLLARVVLSGPRAWSIPLGFLAVGVYFGVLLASRRAVLAAR